MKSISPSPKAYSIGPSALDRDQVTDRQVRWDENTILWGGDCSDDSFPMRLLMAVNQSPTATSCVGTIETFIKGSGFTDEGLMTMPVDSDGTTFWDLHAKFCQYYAVLESYCANFKFSLNKKITSTYSVGVETARFVRPEKGLKKIREIKLNPYFGTMEYNAEYTTPYPVFDPATIGYELKAGIETGQIYFFGTVRPPYKFYPVPKFWSGKDWIYVDGNIQLFHKSNLDNGFFSSAMINVIGDPNQKSKNPKYMKEILASDGVTKKLIPDKTIGEELNDQLNTSFSGARKAGTAWVMWSLNKDQAVNIQAFPVNNQFDILSGTFTDAMRGITTATEVPAILANLPQQASSLGSDGNAIKAAIELMQSKVSAKQQNLENFYNTIMLPNLQAATSAKVKIKNYIPVNTQVLVEDKFWETLTPEEKKTFVKEHIKGFENVATVAPAAPGEEVETPQEKALNENLLNLSGRQQQQLNRITRQYTKGQLSLDQAKLQLKNGFGFDDEDVATWLGLNETV